MQEEQTKTPAGTVAVTSALDESVEGFDAYITLASLRDFFLRTNTQRDEFSLGQGWDYKLGLLMKRSYSSNGLTKSPENIEHVIDGSPVPIMSLNGHEDYAVKVHLPYTNLLHAFLSKPDEVWKHIIAGLDGAEVYHTYFNNQRELSREVVGILSHYDEAPIGFTQFTSDDLSGGYYS